MGFNCKFLTLIFTTFLKYWSHNSQLSQSCRGGNVKNFTLRSFESKICEKIQLLWETKGALEDLVSSKLKIRADEVTITLILSGMSAHFYPEIHSAISKSKQSLTCTKFTFCSAIRKSRFSLGR